MPPKPAAAKGKKTKAEEALDFLSNLDNLDVPPEANASGAPASPNAPEPVGTPAGQVAAVAAASAAEPRASTDSKRSLKAAEVPGMSVSPAPADTTEQDEEAAKALAFLEEQIKTKRAPLSVPGPGSLRTSSPLSGPAKPKVVEEKNVPTAPAQEGAGWGSWWSSATSAIQTAQKMADEGYKKVRTEGVQGLENVKVGGVDLGSLRKGAEERLKGIQGIDLDKLRHDLLSNTQSALTTIINTVAPPISAHETLELWLTHPMIGYAGVEGVVYRAWTTILEQTESGELIINWSPPESTEGLEERGLYPVDGWQAAWEVAVKEIEAVKKREEKEPVGRAKQNPDVPVTIVPIFLHLQPVLAPLAIPEPSLILSGDSTLSSNKAPNHLYFILSLQDPMHSVRFTTTTQPSPGDWLDVEYDRSEWVEERLVDVIRTGIETLAQDYVATRMGLKGSPATPGSTLADQASAATADASTSEKQEKKD